MTAFLNLILTIIVIDVILQFTKYKLYSSVTYYNFHIIIDMYHVHNIVRHHAVYQKLNTYTKLTDI